MKLAYFVSHPIQYQAPLVRRIAQEPDIELKVFYSSDHSVRGYADPGFGGVQVRWDVPLLEGYDYEFLPGFRKQAFGFAAPLSYGIFSRLRRGRFDAVWVHGYHTLNNLQAMIAASLLGIPVLLRTDSTLNNFLRGRTKLALKRIFFALLSPMIRAVMTVGSRNEAYWRFSFRGKVPLFSMPYAVDNDLFRGLAKQASPHRDQLRRQLNLNAGVPVFLFASKIQINKRCMDLVDAFLRLDGEQAYLLIAGDGEQRAAIEQRIQESGALNVRMLGFQNQTEIGRLFDICDVFILPAICEAWGLVVNEAMNAARAIVVSDEVGCAPDLVRDGVNGFVFPAKDIDALSAVLRRFIQDPQLAIWMGERSAEIISSYSFEQDVAGLRQALAHVRPGFKA